MQRAPILVTGGAGFIGSHVCKALFKSGALPICYDTMEKGHQWAVKWGPLEIGDVGDVHRLGDVLRRYRPEAIIHMAGYIEVGESMARPEKYISNNAVKTRRLLTVALEYRVRSVVFSSTCAVYGVPQTSVLDEAHPIAPISPYAASKALAERHMFDAAANGLRVMSLRYFNAAGADPDGEIGEAHEPESHLLPLIADAALGLGPPLTLLGTDYDTADGTCIRDFVHVADLAEGHLRALNWLAFQAAGTGASLNLGSGTGFSVKQVLAEVARISGRSVPHSIGPRRPGDPPRLVGDIAKARQLLGWAPRLSLSDQIRDTLRWRKAMPRGRSSRSALGSVKL